LIDRYLPGAKGMAAEERVRIFRLAWDFAGSALASRNEQYERFYLASSPRNLARHLGFTDRSRTDRLVDRFLKEPYYGRAYSFSSSARASTDGGMARPSAFAVFVLTTSRNVVGCCTGRSAGLAPRRMRSTQSADL